MTAEALAQERAASGVTPTRPPWRQERASVRWRSWLIVVLVVAAGVTLIALAYQPPAPQYLSPQSVGPTGTHALADVLGGLGRTVQTETTVAGARAAAAAGTTLVITSPGNLSPADLRALGRVRANVLLVEPDPPALAAIVPGVALAGPGTQVGNTAPACTLRAAQLAGSVDAGGDGLAVMGTSSPVQQCYPAGSGPTLVQTRVRGRIVTVLSAGALLTNADLARQGNAALAINLLTTRRIVWLVPPFSAPAIASGGNPTSFWSLVPRAAYIVAAQLAFALLLAIGWRGRRLGPLVAERLPVVVHATETVLGHGKLYQSRHARDRAADELRTVLLGRICRAAGLPSRADPAAVVDAVAQRSAADPERIRDLLYGPAPRSDAALATLARDLDDLAREVGVS
jgi:hypothetical protein